MEEICNSSHPGESAVVTNCISTPSAVTHCTRCRWWEAHGGIRIVRCPENLGISQDVLWIDTRSMLVYGPPNAGKPNTNVVSLPPSNCSEQAIDIGYIEVLGGAITNLKPTYFSNMMNKNFGKAKMSAVHCPSTHNGITSPTQYAWCPTSHSPS